MKVVEFEAKTLLQGQGLLIPRGRTVACAEEAAVAAEEIGGAVVVKAQIPSGGRMKAGGVRFAASPAAAGVEAGNLLGSTFYGMPVDCLLVEERLQIAAEVFVGVTYSDQLRRPIILASRTGGIEVESSAAVVQRPFSTQLPAPDFIGREVAAELGFAGHQLVQLSRLITDLANCFLQWDALTLEINPLALDVEGRWWVADVHLQLDDDALFRQPALLAHLSYSRQRAEPNSEFERQAAAIDSADHRGVAGRVVAFDGNLGLLIGGGGASLTAFDAVLDAGLRPANYCEIGGNPSVWKIQELTKLILSQPQVERLAVIMNVVSNTRADLVARGVIKGILALGRDPRDVMAVFRVPGSWEEEGQAILRHYGVPFLDRTASIDQVVEAIQWRS
jgi:succinyl-CoA synthetase beta subunit/citryl-CoA synthetase large subunit